MSEDIKSNFFKSYGRVYDLIEMVFCAYAFAKSIVQGVPNEPNVCLRLATVLLTACILIIVGVLLLITFVYAKAVDLILRFKLGEKYGGRLGEESLFAVAKKPCYVTFLLVFGYDGDEEGFRAFLKRRLFAFYDSDFRYSSALSKYSGYSHYVKNGSDFEEVVQEITCPDADHLSKEALFLSLMNDADEPPGALWNVKIVSLPASGKHGKICPVVVKYHHAIADGVSFLSQLAKVLGEGNSRPKKINPEISLGSEEVSDIFQDVSNLAEKRIHFNIVLRRKGKNLQIANEKCSRLAVYYEEEGDGKYVGLIRKIKGRFEGMTFTEVLYTACTSSFYDYYSQLDECPEKLNFAMLVRPRGEADLNFCRGIYDSDHVGNNAVLAYMQLPFGKFPRISERLLAVHEKWRPKNFLDDQMSSWFRKVVMRYWPDWMVKSGCCFLEDVDLGVTNLPGMKLKNLSGAKLQDFFFYVPPILDENFRLFVSTQDERFHAVLAANEDAGLSDEDLRNVLRRTFSYLDVLEEQTRYVSANSR